MSDIRHSIEPKSSDLLIGEKELPTDTSFGQELLPVQEEDQQPPFDFGSGFDTIPSQFDEIFQPSTHEVSLFTLFSYYLFL